LLTYLTARTKSNVTIRENQGKQLHNPLVSIPLKDAQSILESHKKRNDKIEQVKKIAEELSRQLDGEYMDYNPRHLRHIANIVLIKLNELDEQV